MEKHKNYEYRIQWFCTQNGTLKFWIGLYYSVWSGVAIIHHVTIENTSDIAYKDIKVRVLYYSNSITDNGKQISQETGILPVVVPPHSKNTYLKGGSTLGASSMGMYAGYLEVLGAVPLIEQEKSK